MPRKSYWITDPSQTQSSRAVHIYEEGPGEYKAFSYVDWGNVFCGASKTMKTEAGVTRWATRFMAAARR